MLYHTYNWGMDKVEACRDIISVLVGEMQNGTIWGDVKYIKSHIQKNS